MSGSSDAKPSPRPQARASAREDVAAFSKSAARDDAVALLRLAGLDAELERLRQWKAAGLAEERDRALARVSAPLRERYEAAVQEGRRPALVAVHDGRCPGCGEALPDASQRLVQESLRVVPCSGCLRLLYDRGWTERDLMPPTLRPVARAKP